MLKIWLVPKTSSWEARSYLVTQGIPRILWNRMVHYRVYKTSSLVPILGQISPLHTIPFLCYIFLRVAQTLFFSVFIFHINICTPIGHTATDIYTFSLELVFSALYRILYNNWMGNKSWKLISRKLL